MYDYIYLHFNRQSFTGRNLQSPQMLFTHPFQRGSYRECEKTMDILGHSTIVLKGRVITPF